jgi:hypothetical protein
VNYVYIKQLFCKMPLTILLRTFGSSAKLGCRFLFVGGALWPLALGAQGTFQARFDHSSYSVAPGEVLAVGVVIDPVPVSGLFSFGVRINFDPLEAQPLSAASIVVPLPLDFNSVLGPGASRVVDAGMAAVKGTVQFSAVPPPAYTGSLLATFYLKNADSTLGKTYPLSLQLFRTLGPAESVFVNGLGQPLDAQMIFGSAVVTVIPEPCSWMLLALGGLLLRRTELVYRSGTALGDSEVPTDV